MKKPNIPALAADIVSRIHNSPDNPTNLAQTVTGLIEQEFNEQPIRFGSDEFFQQVGHDLCSPWRNFCRRVSSWYNGLMDEMFPSYSCKFTPPEPIMLHSQTVATTMHVPSSYYPLWEHLAKEHNLILLESEMDQILRMAAQCGPGTTVVQNFSRPIVHAAGVGEDRIYTVCGSSDGPNSFFDEVISCPACLAIRNKKHTI